MEHFPPQESVAKRVLYQCKTVGLCFEKDLPLMN